MARKRKPSPAAAVAEPITIDVHSVTNFAHYAGLTVEVAESALLDAEMDDCRVIGMGCSEFCGLDPEVRTLVALRVFQDRDVIFCEGCHRADIGV